MHHLLERTDSPPGSSQGSPGLVPGLVPARLRAGVQYICRKSPTFRRSGVSFATAVNATTSAISHTPAELVPLRGGVLEARSRYDSAPPAAAPAATVRSVRDLLESKGYTLQALRTMGYSAPELIAAGYTVSDIDADDRAAAPIF